MHLQTRWPDLLPDLLRQISGRLHHTIDFVRFHAVCRSWRDSYHPMATGTSRFFLPWLLAPNMKNCDALRLTCVFFKMSYHSPHIPTSPCWVANADGTAARYFGRYPYYSLHDPLTGRVATLVPHVPHDKDKWFRRYTYPRGVVYGDGTILLYSIQTISRNEDLDGGGNTTKFRAALMRPGDVAWTVVERILEAIRYGETCVAYHGGKIFVSVDASQWHVVMLNDDVVGDMLVPTPSMLPNQGDYYYQCGHVLKSRGELLWVSLHILTSQDDECGKDACDLVQALSLSVYGIQEVSVSNKIRWVKKDGKSLADRILFLGSSYSFAIDASQLGVDGGYAYFVHSDGKVDPYEWSAVLRYNLVDKKAEFVQWLPQGWRDDMCAWLVPKPTIIAPILASAM